VKFSLMTGCTTSTSMKTSVSLRMVAMRSPGEICPASMETSPFPFLKKSEWSVVKVALRWSTRMTSTHSLCAEECWCTSSTMDQETAPVFGLEDCVRSCPLRKSCLMSCLVLVSMGYPHLLDFYC